MDSLGKSDDSQSSLFFFFFEGVVSAFQTKTQTNIQHKKWWNSLMTGTLYQAFSTLSNFILTDKTSLFWSCLPTFIWENAKKLNLSEFMQNKDSGCLFFQVPVLKDPIKFKH